MRSNFSTLLKINFQNHSGINAFFHEKDRKKRNRSMGMGVAITIVAIVIMIYCFLIGYGLGYMKMSQIIPGYALTITGMITLIMTFLKTNGYLFAFKDYDLLLALPIKIQSVIGVKFLYMYFFNFLFSLAVMLPMGVSYAFWVRPEWSVYLMWILGMVLAPLLPMTIASAIGALIAGVAAKVKVNKVLVQVVLSTALIAAVLFGSFWMQNSANADEAAFLMKLTDIGKEISNQMHRIYLPSEWFDRAVSENSFTPFLVFMLTSIGWYLVFLGLTGKGYRKINTALMSHHAKSNYRMETLKTSTALMAIVKKEVKRFLSSAIYLLNMGMGMLMALGLSIASIFVNMGELTNVKGILYVVPFLIAMMVNMTCTTAVSWSLEGKNLWIVQSLPISRKTLFGGKMLFNIFLVLPVSILCSICFIISLQPSLLLALLYLLFAVVSSLFSTVWGMWVNIHFPNFEWENDVQVVKQGASSAIGIFSSLLGYMLLGGIAFLLSRYVAGEVVLFGISFIIGGLAIGIYKKL